MSAKTAIEEVFTKPLAERIWTANTLTAYPATLQHFSVGSVLPAVFYMFRRGFRRGRGKFRESFGANGAQMRPTIFSVAGRLSLNTSDFIGFDSELRKDILGDLLLCDALENKGHAEGHQLEVQRAFPVHYFSSWLDLPESVANLRFVPEMLVALLANQTNGRFVQPTIAGDFPMAGGPEENLLFKVFARGVEFGSNATYLAADSAREDENYSVDELLMIRLAQTCNQAPEKMRVSQGASAEIFNLSPLGRRATSIFRADLAVFLKSFGVTIPRRALTPMLESLIGLGLWHSFLGSLAAVVSWEREGKVPVVETQHPPGVLVDASSGTDTRLRDLSELSVDDVLRFLDEATVALASLRILDAKGYYDFELKSSRPDGGDTTAWLNLLGAVRRNAHRRSATILNDLSEKALLLGERLRDGGREAEALAILHSLGMADDPVRVLAENVCSLMGQKLLRGHYLKFLDSAAMVNEPHGLVRKRRVSRVMPGGKRKMMDARSVVLSNTLLEALVHRYLVERAGRLSFSEFLKLLGENYGLWVDGAPSGLEASREDLLRNRALLEHRLRDLGLLVGVNDAETMKNLRPRYPIPSAT